MSTIASAPREEPSFPAVHVLHLMELVGRWGVPGEEIIAGLPIEAAALTDPAARVSARCLEQVVGKARELTAEPALGVFLGLSMRVSAHGYLGFAAMTAPTVRDAIELAVRFAPTRTNALSLRLAVDASSAALAIEEHAELGGARDAIILALMVGIWQIGNALTGRTLDGVAECAFPQPAYAPRLSALIEKVRFDRPENRLVFDRSVLDLPSNLADPAASRLALDQCERALESLQQDGRVTPRLRALFEQDQPRSVEDAAKRLSLSPRTLKRRLAAEGASYSELADDHQRKRAVVLLASPDLSLDEIAERLGYSDAPSFTRAFRRWTGTTPASYRKSRSGDS